MVWNDELKREIPEGWGADLLSSLGTIVSGATPSTKNEKNYTKNGIGWITPNDLSKTSNKYIAHGERDITKEGVNSCSTVLVPKGTVLLTSRAPIGYLAIASDTLCTNQGFKSIIPNKGYSSEYIYNTIKSLVPHIKVVGVGSTFTEVSKETLGSIKVYLPPIKLVNSFELYVKVLSEKRYILEQENQELASLRDFLLPLLMNGQVTFKEDE